MRLAKDFHDRAHRTRGYIGDDVLEGFVLDAVDFFHDDFGPRHAQFVAFAAHLLDEDGQVQFAPAGHAEAFAAQIFDPQRDVGEEFAV